MEQNIKIKQILKRTLENKTFESSFVDEDEEYTFNYYIEVGKVVGKGGDTVARINVVITDIDRDGDDYYYDWSESDYSSFSWYINRLSDTLYYEILSMYPFTIGPTFYGYDEYADLSDSEKHL
jgi:predicted RNA-binding protein YlqC (UPF0109 family)